MFERSLNSRRNLKAKRQSLPKVNFTKYSEVLLGSPLLCLQRRLCSPYPCKLRWRQIVVLCKTITVVHFTISYLSVAPALCQTSAPRTVPLSAKEQTPSSNSKQRTTFMQYTFGFTLTELHDVQWFHVKEVYCLKAKRAPRTKHHLSVASAFHAERESFPFWSGAGTRASSPRT